MTRDEAAAIVNERVIQREGGVKDVGDGKGVTRFGQTPDWLEQFGLPAPTTVAEAGANYQTWLVKTGLIGICALADDLADVTIDFAVNADHRTAIRGLQRALKIHVDGIWGPETQAAVDACQRARMARAVIAGRVRFIGDLITSKPEKYSRWARGWTARVAAQIEALG